MESRMNEARIKYWKKRSRNRIPKIVVVKDPLDIPQPLEINNETANSFEAFQMNRDISMTIQPPIDNKNSLENTKILMAPRNLMPRGHTRSLYN